MSAASRHEAHIDRERAREPSSNEVEACPPGCEHCDRIWKAEDQRALEQSVRLGTPFIGRVFSESGA